MKVNIIKYIVFTLIINPLILSVLFKKLLNEKMPLFNYDITNKNPNYTQQLKKSGSNEKMIKFSKIEYEIDINSNLFNRVFDNISIYIIAYINLNIILLREKRREEKRREKIVTWGRRRK